jgi:ferredoxin
MMGEMHASEAPESPRCGDAALDWEVVVDRDVCMGAGMCVRYAGNTFDLDGETRSYVKCLHGDLPATIETAVQACPTGALSIVARDQKHGDPP